MSILIKVLRVEFYTKRITLEKYISMTIFSFFTSAEPEII